MSRAVNSSAVTQNSSNLPLNSLYKFNGKNENTYFHLKPTYFAETDIIIYIFCLFYSDVVYTIERKYMNAIRVFDPTKRP